VKRCWADPVGAPLAEALGELLERVTDPMRSAASGSVERGEPVGVERESSRTTSESCSGRREASCTVVGVAERLDCFGRRWSSLLDQRVAGDEVGDTVSPAPASSATMPNDSVTRC
jgi:hypothetical protein